MENYIGKIDMLVSSNTRLTWSNIFFQAVDNKDKKIADNYCRKLKKVGDVYSYIYELILHSANNEAINYNDLERLRNEYDNEFVRRAKMRLIDKLNFSEFDYMQIARDIKNIETPEEYYFRGMWEEHSGDKNKAVNFYKRALKQGYEKAGKKLFDLAKNDIEAIRFLSDQMVPEANFKLGEINRSNNKYAVSNRYFKLAAAKGYIPAIKMTGFYTLPKKFWAYKTGCMYMILNHIKS